MKDGSGENLHESFAKLNQDGSWLKTSRGCYQQTLEGHLQKFSGTWPRAGMMRSGMCFQQEDRVALVRRIKGKESSLLQKGLPTPTTNGLEGGSDAPWKKTGETQTEYIQKWPTPDANMGNRGTQPNWKRKRPSGHHAQYTINQAVRDNPTKWPTPTEKDHRHLSKGAADRADSKNQQVRLAGRVMQWPTPTAHIAKEAGYPAEFKRKTPTLTAEVHKRMWPTPNASDNRDRGHLGSGAVQRRMEKGKQIMLSQSVSKTSGALNPTWVEWLMGFPIGWTDLKHLETQLSPRSQNKSEK